MAAPEQAAAERRDTTPDRRARSRSGRREHDAKPPWYMRRPLWLAAASVLYVGWRRVVGRKQTS